MHKIILASLLFSLISCQESLDDRCEREVREYTNKKCPTTVGENIVLDSMVFHKGTHTLQYYYTIGGPLDDDKTLIKGTEIRKKLLEQLRNTVSLKSYKEAGYSFATTFWSASKRGEKLAEYTFTQKDY